MANSNAPYGFRFWNRLVPGTGSVATAPGAAAGGTLSSSGQVPIPSAATLKVGDPLHVSLGLGYLAVTTNAIFGIVNSPVPNFNETAVQKHYPEIIPADDQTIWRVQSMGTKNVTQGLLGMPNKYRLSGSSGAVGIDFTHTTGGVLVPIALAPGSAFGTYAEVLVLIVRGAFYGQA